jgi:3-oxoacyl-[acyl-carrier-protein] synthase II
VLGEGAAMVILEDWRHAEARGARIHAELVGYGLCTDAAHITRPTVEGQAAAMRRALDSAAMPGHLLGAAGALEFVAAVLALERQIIPPTINLHVPDPECDLDYVPGKARTGVDLDAAMSNSFAFGGLNAVLVFGPPPA